MKGKGKQMRERIFPAFYALITYLFSYAAFAFFIFVCKGEVENEEKIRHNLRTGFVIASNHVSYLDWLVLFAYFHFRYHIRVLFIAKNKLFSHPLWNLVARGARVVRVSDCGTRILSIKDFRRLMSAKYIGIFPEGTRSSTGRLHTPHGGAIKLAARNNIPLIPVRLEGFYEAWPRERKLPRSHPCRIIIGTECHFDQAHVTQADEATLASCTYKILQTLRPAKIESERQVIPLKTAYRKPGKHAEKSPVGNEISRDGT